METFEVKIQGDRYEVSYHPHITKFMIVANHTGQFLMMLDIEGKWRCLNTTNVFSDRLPVAQLYSHTEQQRKSGIQKRPVTPRRALL